MLGMFMFILKSNSITRDGTLFKFKIDSTQEKKMGLKTLELTVISAKDLKNVNLIGKMDVYVVVKISGDPKSKQKTSVHQDGGTNPSWNYTMRFNIDEAAAQYGWFLEFDLRHETTFGGDKELGEVKVPLNELLDSVRGKDPHAPQFVTYQVRRSSGKSHGELKFSYKFTDVGQSSRSSSVYPPPVAAPYPHPPPQQPPTGYPMPPQQPPAGYPPPPTAVPYGAPGYPPHGGYGYAPAGYGYAPAGYAAPPQAGYLQTQKPKKNNFGLGLGAGLIGGAIGGLVLGEVVDDAFDSGYDAGFDDSGGFDF